MKTKTRLLTLAGSLGLLAWLPSCQTTSPHAAMGHDAVMCDKCKTVWVKQPQSVGPGGKVTAMVYRDVKVMACPECESAVLHFFKSGEFKHHCSHCGGSMTHCTHQ